MGTALLHAMCGSKQLLEVTTARALTRKARVLHVFQVLVLHVLLLDVCK